jgi:hypothetical protein
MRTVLMMKHKGELYDTVELYGRTKVEWSVNPFQQQMASSSLTEILDIPVATSK